MPDRVQEMGHGHKLIDGLELLDLIRHEIEDTQRKPNPSADRRSYIRGMERIGMIVEDEVRTNSVTAQRTAVRKERHEREAQPCPVS